MRRNKEPEELPEEETKRTFECIFMDDFTTAGGENGLALIDKHTGFVWAWKVGVLKTGTTRIIRNTLDETMWPNMYIIKRMKTDNGKNLIIGALKELSKELKI